MSLGYQTKVGIGLEATEGTAVIAQHILEHRSDNIEGEYSNVVSKALRMGRFPGVSAPGSQTVQGSLVAEFTPDKITKLLYAAMGACASVGGLSAVASIAQTAGLATVTTTPDHGLVNGDLVTIAGADQAGYNLTLAVVAVTGAKTFTYAVDAGTVSPATGATITITGPSRHTLTIGQAGPKAFTHSIAKGLLNAAGAIIETHSGCMIDSLTLAADLDEFLLATMDIQGLGEAVDVYSTARDTAVFGTAASSVLNPFAYVQGLFTLNSSANNDARNVTIKIGNALKEKRVIRRNRAALGHAPGMVEVTLDADMYFSSDLERRRLMGVASGAATPFTATTTVIPGSASVDFLSEANQLVLTLPNLQYQAAGAPVEGDDWIMQKLTARALYHSSGGLQAVLTNRESGTVLTGNGTDIT